ncbi:5'-nucleotidase [Salinibacillus kushneri]|uniref:5'-nucleotidase n=1 Tax=Salinibacillus kushneri TaxID=237682 RepID=A0A1I0DRY9_9BACI|nr:metallophosphoesterase [Salinibacillus kushneri]SET35352.1 5'-nucleotidase [Salinibacillus kushneri]
MIHFLKVMMLSFTVVCGMQICSYAESNHNISVKILGINDFHGQLESPSSDEEDIGGAAYLSAYLKQYQRENKHTLLVHTGDAVGNSPPISAKLQDKPTIKFLNKLHFDVGTVGNHEFDEGVNQLMGLIKEGKYGQTGEFKGANFPYTVANVLHKNTKKPILPPYIIKRVRGIPIGFIGVLTPKTKRIVDEEHIKDIKFKNITESINKAVHELKEKGVKTIVVLAHASAASKKDGSNPSGEIVKLAPKLDDEIDVILAGHNHKYANTVVDNKLIVEAYAKGKAFSEVDIQIDLKTKDVLKKQAKVVKTYHKKIEPDKEIQSFVEQTRLKLKKRQSQ